VSHRVTIAVPDELFERLQAVKHNFNISSICQEALEMAITCEELKQQAQGQENLVERLRVEKNVLLNKVHQEGFELGIRSSSKLSYKDYQHFERVSSLAEALDEDVLDYLWSFLDLKEYPEQARLHDPDFAHLLEVDPQSRITFAQGWLEGVLSIWQAIKTHVDIKQN
jgi:post-segregation antitoxin (ccd killing protein)